MSTAPQQQTAEASEVRNVAVDMRGRLDSGELLTGTPVVTEIGSSDLTFSNKAVNTVAKVIRGATVPIGQAVLFKITGFVAGANYRLKISIGTDAVPAQTLIEFIRIRVYE